jgi:hypothetical protein
MATCSWCAGTGFIAQGITSETCPECLGTGEVDNDEDNYSGSGSLAPTPPSPSRHPKEKKSTSSGCASGGCGGCGIGLLSIVIGIGLAGIPVIGWMLAVGFIGAGFLWPFLGAWAGSQTEVQ